MKYKNKITGFVLESISEVKGENWEKLDSPSTLSDKETKPKTRKAKK